MPYIPLCVLGKTGGDGHKLFYSHLYPVVRIWSPVRWDLGHI